MSYLHAHESHKTTSRLFAKPSPVNDFNLEWNNSEYSASNVEVKSGISTNVLQSELNNAGNPEKGYQNLENIQNMVADTPRERNSTATFCSFCKLQFPSFSILLKHYLGHNNITVNDLKDLIMELINKSEALEEENKLLREKLRNYCNKESDQNDIYLKGNETSFKKEVEDSDEDEVIDSYNDKNLPHFSSESDNADAIESLKSNKNKNCKDQNGPLKDNLFNHEILLNIKNENILKATNNLLEIKLVNLKIPPKNLKNFRPATRDAASKTKIEKNSNLFENSNKIDEKNYNLINFIPKKGSKQKHKCNICKKEFKFKCHLKRHSIKHEKTYQCKECLEIFVKYKDLLSHMVMHTTHKKKYECGVCNKQFIGFHYRNRHVAQKHFPDNPLQCDVCREILKSREEFLVHVKEHFPDVEKYKCDYCSKELEYKDSLRSHIEGHFSNTLHYCEFCPKTFKKREYLLSHLKEHRVGKKRNICKICKKTFSYNRELEQHMFRHTNNPFTCLVCKDVFSTLKDLRFHTHIVHSKKKTVSCNVCGKEFLYQAQVRIHMKTHTRERTFLCSYCGQSFLSQVAVDKHTFKHTGGDNFQCDFCKEYFPLKNALERHILGHTGYKPYICQYCGKGCTEMGNLNQHIRTHTGEKPKRCDICGKGFLRNSFLFQHMEKEHSVINNAHNIYN